MTSDLSGILIIDKPEGWTSHDVVAKLRGALRQKCRAQRKLRVGHGGTLDPMATGVLPIFIGRATRAVEFCENAEKEYIAGIRFGIVTDTQDITGNVLSSRDASVTADELGAVLPRFLGHLKQIPPMYSAVKQNGKKLYELARKGVEVERKARDIEIKAIEIVSKDAVIVSPTPVIASEAKQSSQYAQQEFYLRVVCSKGTYIRTLCHDIGQVLGCGAVMSYLHRTRAGVYGIGEAYTLESVINAFEPKILLPTGSIFSQYPSVTLCDDDTKKAKNGALRKLSGTDDGKYRFYDQDGEFLLFGEIKNGSVHVIKNFFEV